MRRAVLEVFTLLTCALASSLVGCGKVMLDGGDGGTAPVQGEGGVDAAVDSQQPVVTSSCSGGGEGGSAGYTVALTTPEVPRFYPNGDPYPFRPADESPNAIDSQDCEDDISLQFNVTEGGLGTSDSPDILQVWAGTADCTQASARSGAESPFCWQIYAAQELTTVATIDISARSLTEYVGTALTSVPNGGNPIDGTDLPASACASVGTVTGCQIPVGIYFMFLSNSGAAVPDAATVYPVGIFVPSPDGGACSTPSPVSLGPTSCG